MRSSLLDCTQGRAWHDITAIGQHTIGRCRAWHDITALGQHTRSDYVRHGMTSLHLYNTLGRTTSSVACHYRLRAAHTIKRSRAGHARIAHGRQTRSNNVGRGMPSLPLGSTHGRTTSGVECRHGSWTPHTVERSQAWHAIIALERQTRFNDVRRGMPSSPLD